MNSQLNPTKIAFIGAGYMASEHLKAFYDLPNVHLSGIFTRTIDKALALKSVYPDLEIYDSINSLYSKTKADLVVIAVPELACLSVCEEAFIYPWKLLIEKPVGYNFSEALKIEMLANELNSEVYVALNRRFYSSTIQAINKLKNLQSNRLITILDQEDAIGALASGQPEKVVKNWMYANSLHLIDYFSMLCRGEHVTTKIIEPWEPKRPKPVMAKLIFSSGDIGIYQGIWNAPGPWSVAISTEELRMELRPIEQLSLQQKGSRSIEMQAIDPLDNKYKPGIYRQAEEAVKAARNIKNSLPMLEDANRSMSLVSSIYQSQ